MSAFDDIIIRAECLVGEGKRDAEKIIRECYDLEVYDDFSWELLHAVFSPGELILRADVEEELVQYCIDELEDEVQDMIDDAEEDEEDEEDECEVVDGIPWHRLSASFAAKASKFPPQDALGFRERDVLEHLERAEWTIDNGHVLYRYFHEDGEHDFTWDATQRLVNG